MTTLTNPAQTLLGLLVNGHWRVEEQVNLKADGSTGGHFCVPYKVVHSETGQKAFLKVLDVVKAIQSYQNLGKGSVAYTLSRITSAHVFEAKLMEECKDCDRIVKVLDYGEIGLDLPPYGTVGFPFLIFELAEGDTHRFLPASGALDHAWWFSTLHQAARGVAQLHARNIVHQDIKPSNVVFFGMDNAKITDLGRAAQKGFDSLNDDRAGDARYAPPELHFGYVSSEWSERFLAMDLFLLGGLAFTGVAQIPITLALFAKLPPALKPASGIDYKDAILPLRKALADLLEDYRNELPPVLRENFTTIVKQLCDPDPALRGHPKNHAMRHGSKFSVERYISIFHRMALDAKAMLKR